jgi:hypothetical protein
MVSHSSIMQAGHAGRDGMMKYLQREGLVIFLFFF